MATVNWGMLQKSAVDSETIEQAIDRLIAVHEVDETSHLGVGESLQSHKASEIIDHAALSIIEDKIADGEITGVKLTSDQIVGKDFRTDLDVGSGVDGIKFNSSAIEAWEDGVKKVDIPKTGNANFQGNIKVKSIEYEKLVFNSHMETLDPFSLIKTYARGTITISGICNCQLSPGSTAGDRVEVRLIGTNMSFDFPDSHPVLDSVLIVGQKSDEDMMCALYQDVNQSETSGIGFRWSATDQKLYAFRFASNTEYKSEITGVDVESWHEYRVEVLDDSIVYYIDGVLKYTATTNLPSENLDMIVNVGFKSLAGNGSTCIIRSILFINDNYN